MQGIYATIILVVTVTQLTNLQEYNAVISVLNHLLSASISDRNLRSGFALFKDKFLSGQAADQISRGINSAGILADKITAHYKRHPEMTGKIYPRSLRTCALLRELLVLMQAIDQGHYTEATKVRFLL